MVKKRISQAEYIRDTIWDVVELVLSAVGAYIGKNFDRLGYVYRDDLSNEREIVFERRC